MLFVWMIAKETKDWGGLIYPGYVQCLLWQSFVLSRHFCIVMSSVWLSIFCCSIVCHVKRLSYPMSIVSDVFLSAVWMLIANYGTTVYAGKSINEKISILWLIFRVKYKKRYTERGKTYIRYF